MAENKSKKQIKWNEQDEKRYNWLYNLLTKSGENLNKENYLYKYNKRNLQQFINNLDKSVSTKESFYFMVAKWLKLNKPEDTTISNFTNLGHKLMMERSKDYGENKLSERKQTNYRDYSYFVDILNSINYKEIKTYRSHLQYLLLSLLIKQPPLRTSFYRSAEFHTKGSRDQKNNYVMLFTAGKPRVNFYVGKDKVSNSKFYKEDVLRSFIDV